MRHRRTPYEWRRYDEDTLGAWWSRWEKILRRNDPLLETLAAGDNLAFFAQKIGLGRSKWIARALVDADMWDRRVLVICRPMVRLYWRQTLNDAGMNAAQIEIISAFQAGRSGLDIEIALHEKFEAADVIIIEPAARPGSKQLAGLAKQIRYAHTHPQIITTTTLIWGAQLKPPAYADSCFKLLGYLDAPDDIKVCWAEDCWEAAA